MLYLKGESGAGLLSSIMVLGLMTTFSMTALTRISTAQRTATTSERHDEIISLRMLIQRKVDCANTLNGATCDGKPGLTLRDRSGASLTNQDQKIGRWSLRASCQGKRVRVEFAHILKADRGGDQPVRFASDALNGNKIFQWTNIQDGGDPELCADAAGKK